MDISTIKTIIFFSILFMCLFTDLSKRKIYNVVTIPSILLGILINVWHFHSLAGILFSIKGLGFALGVFFILYTLGWFGAGDAKLMGVIGSFMGFHFAVNSTIAVLIAGGLISLLFVLADIVKSRKQSPVIVFFISLKNKIFFNMPLIWPDKNKSKVFPYSLAICSGVLFTYIFI